MRKPRDKLPVRIFPSPIPKGVTTKIVYPTGKYAHEKYSPSKYAKDFITPVETPIEAMECGKVVYMKSDSNRYGLDKEYANDANIIAIKGDDRSVIEYIHFGQDQIYFKKGDRVKEGQVLGLSGMSGCMDIPQVHVNRFKKINRRLKSIPYDVEGVEDERAINESSQRFKKRASKSSKLEQITGVIFIMGITIGLLSLSGITGNIIGSRTITNSIGAGLLIIGLIAGFFWLKKRS